MHGRGNHSFFLPLDIVSVYIVNQLKNLENEGAAFANKRTDLNFYEN